MAMSPDNLAIIADLYRRGYFRMPAAIADIGCQQVCEDCSEVSRQFLANFGRSVAPGSPALLTKDSFTGFLFEAAGFYYKSFDIEEAPFCEHFNLNVDLVPEKLRNRFDLVLNFGTTEHVMNQYNSMRTMHDFAKPGGLMYTLFLVNGYQWHGIIRYTTRFIDLMVGANGYEVVWDDTYSQTYSQWRAGVGPDEPEENYYRDTCRWMILKKTSDKPFNEIVDVP